MSLAQRNILFEQHVYAIDHFLHQLHFRVPEPVLVRDIVSNPSLTTTLPPSTSGLQSQLLTPGLQDFQPKFCPSWQVNVNRCPHASPKVSGTGMNIAVFLRKHEVLTRLSLNGFLDRLDPT